MSVTTSLPTTRGGGRYKISPFIAETRLRRYYTRKGKILVHLKPRERQLAVWVLKNQYSFKTSELQRIFKVSERQLNKDFATAVFYIERNKAYREDALNIDRYILYMADYIPLSQAVATE